METLRTTYFGINSQEFNQKKCDREKSNCITDLETQLDIPFYCDGQSFHLCALKFDLSDEVLNDMFIRLY